MRRLHPLYVSFLAACLVACTDPPKPSSVSKEELAKIKKGDDDTKGDEESALGAIPAGFVAKVGEVEISNEKFTSIYELKVKKYSDRGREIPTSADRRYRKSIAERLIYHEVLAQEAKALGVEHDADALAAREAQQKRGIRDWEKHLSRRGETEDSLRAMYVAELREKAILEKNGALDVSPEEIDADYEKIKGNWTSDNPRVRASHILVPIGPKKERANPGEKAPEPTAEEQVKWDAEAKATASELHKAVTAADADFAAIATAKSTGPSAAKGGDVGIFTADRMTEEFSAAAFAMEVGEISAPIKTKFGYHIIKVTGSWGPGELPKEALNDQIVNRLRQRKLHQGRRELKDKLLEKYTIVDNIKPTLGPEPERKRPKPRRHGDGDGHGHGKTPKLEGKPHKLKGAGQRRNGEDGAPVKGEDEGDAPAKAKGDAASVKEEKIRAMADKKAAPTKPAP